MSVQLVSKISNLCDHNPPTLQTDGRTDRRTTCDPKTALCTNVHCAVTVRPSVTLVDCDHMRWNSSKIISRMTVLCILVSRASADRSTTDLLQTDHLQILARIEVHGVGKIVDFQHLSRRISETVQLKIGSKLLLNTNRNMYKRF